MTADEPAPEPGPEWMTDEELAQIEQEYGWLDDYSDSGWREMAARVPALLAELRHLRAEWWKDHLMG